MEFGHDPAEVGKLTRPATPTDIKGVIERVKPVLDAAGASGEINGILVGDPYVVVQLSEPPDDGRLDLLAEQMRSVLGDDIDITVQFGDDIAEA